MKLSNTAYDIIALIGRILLPSLATLYVTLGNLWALPYTEPISGTLVALAAFVNAFLEYEKALYNKTLPVEE